MGQPDIEPLDPDVWRSHLDKLAARLQDEGVEASSVRHAFHLMQLAPRSLRRVTACNLAEDEFEALLEAGQLPEAARALVGDHLQCSLERPEGTDRVAAEVWAPGETDAHSAEAACLASALLQAWIGCLATLCEQTHPSGKPLSHRSPRKPRSAPRRTWSAR